MSQNFTGYSLRGRRLRQGYLAGSKEMKASHIKKFNLNFLPLTTTSTVVNLMMTMMMMMTMLLLYPRSAIESTAINIFVNIRASATLGFQPPITTP